MEPQIVVDIVTLAIVAVLLLAFPINNAMKKRKLLSSHKTVSTQTSTFRDPE